MSAPTRRGAFGCEEPAGERQTAPDRLVDKDAHDIYRLLVAVPTDRLAARLSALRVDGFAGPSTEKALLFLAEMFGGSEATGSTMAGRAEEGIGDPSVVAAGVERGVADIRNTRKVRALAADLRDECALRGVSLVAGEAEEILALKIGDIARQIGVTERTVLERYLPDDVVHALATSVGRAGEIYREAVEAAGPVTIEMAYAGRVIAALGMTAKLATDALDHTSGRADTLGVATDCADAVVGIGVAVRNADNTDQVQISGATLVHVRKVLQRAIELIRDGRWACPCRSRHAPGATCTLQRQLISDLNLVGGWPAGQPEAPGHDR